MKILVLNGSPKGEKSDTLKITRAFLEGMRAVEDQEIQFLTVIDRQIEFCRGCFACKTNGGSCVIRDDMQGILEQMVSSDLLLFSFPLYCFGMPAPLKNLIDRTMPLSSMAMEKVDGRYAHIRQRGDLHPAYLMISGCGFPDCRNNFEPALLQFERLFPARHTLVTVPESPLFNAPGAAEVTLPRLEKVKEAGRQYAREGRIDSALLEEIRSPMIPEDAYVRQINESISRS